MNAKTNHYQTALQMYRDAGYNFFDARNMAERSTERYFAALARA